MNLQENIYRIREMMGLIVEEQQDKSLFTEQSAPVKIGCHDYNKIEILCSTLVFPKAEADKLIAKYGPIADKYALEKINSLSQKYMDLGGEEAKKIAEKFTSSINNSKTQISKILIQYYPQAVYATCGLGPKVNISQINLQICGIIYTNFIKAWNENWLYRNIANAAMDQSNIKQVQSFGKQIFDIVISEISSMVDWYYMDSASYFVDERVYQMEKTTPKCSNVIIIQDKGCNSLPKPQWYNPNQKYKNIGTSIIVGNGEALARKTYSPKLVEFLNNLV
jgi:hypothetical protein